LLGFDLGQGDWLGDRFSGLDFEHGVFGVGRVDGDDGSGAHGAFVLTGLVNDQPVARRHRPNVFQGDGVRNAVPLRGFVALQVGERVFGRFGLEQIVGSHGALLCSLMLAILHDETTSSSWESVAAEYADSVKRSHFWSRTWTLDPSGSCESCLFKSPRNDTCS